jgi:hypothetical protein
MSDLGHRAQAFAAITEYLESFGRDVTIVETGCLRQENNWAGDGQSTLVWDAFVNYQGGQVWSVDIDAKAVQLAQSLTSDKTIVKRSDSVAFLTYLALKSGLMADFLYLDSFDIDWAHPVPSQEHHERELEAALPMLRSGSVVAVDDNQPHAGKGYLVGRYAQAEGWPVLVDTYVRAWIVK